MLTIRTSLAQREAEAAAAPLRADRRLFLTADKSRVVEEGDTAAAFLFVAAGDGILSGEAGRYGLGLSDGKVTLPSTPD